jgi:uncharacterized peroxidase-related enzyme
LQGEEHSEAGQALRDGRLDDLPVTDAERLLLEFVGTLTQHAYRTTDEQVEGLRQVGWTDEDILDIAQVAAMFNFTNRLASGLGWVPNEEYFTLGR